MNARRTLLLALGGLVLAIGLTFLLDPYRNYQLALAAAYLCATAGLTVLVGLSGQLSLGHAALMAAGGYGYALTSQALTSAGVGGVPRVLAATVAAAVAAGVLGLLLGLAGARLHGPYLAGLTLTLVVAVPAVAASVGALQGDRGVRIEFEGVPGPLKALIALEQWQAWVALAVAAVAVTGLALVRDGRTGLRMRAVRDDEVAAALAGIAPARVKVLAFVVSSVTAGLGGAVLTFVTQSVSPGAYTVSLSLLLLVAVVVGGLGSLLGAALGAVLLVLLPWLVGTLTDMLPLPSQVTQRLDGTLPLLVFGLLLIVLVAGAPGGLAGALTAARDRRRARRRLPAPGPTAARLVPTAGDDPTGPAARPGSVGPTATRSGEPVRTPTEG
ncbi:ABC transporter permease subunit [Cellulomonas xiejunii]|uniref:ABC transporter permease subunit n=1 Tax=Cellulomonas xiejunii TaxID=2968083 RepID=UPI001D0DCBF1|nr:branched-chain amino acid ABC transporter permease [Cellulomonas xiejunii]MCC2313583.1 branched-chain amino acid ABC transporter permease [Cellulomonas xiejunii]